MKKFRNKILLAIILVISIIVGIVFSNVEHKEYKEKIIHATYSINVNNLRNIISDADYVFVAKVNKTMSTVYKYPVKLESKWIKSPYTYYNVRVIKNIKGTLSTKKNVKILKAGGKDKSSRIKYVYDNDTLPTPGRYYIMSAYVQKDGSLLVSGTNSTITTLRDYRCSLSYKKMVKEKNRADSINRKRYRIKSKKIYI